MKKLNKSGFGYDTLVVRWCSNLVIKYDQIDLMTKCQCFQNTEKNDFCKTDVYRKIFVVFSSTL